MQTEFVVINAGTGHILHRPITKQKAEDYSNTHNRFRTSSQCITKVLEVCNVKNAKNYTKV